MKAINNNLLCYFSRLHEVFHYLGTPWLQYNRNRTCSSWPLQHNHTHLGLFLSSDNTALLLLLSISLPLLLSSFFNLLHHLQVLLSFSFSLSPLTFTWSNFFPPWQSEQFFRRNALDFHSCKLLLNLIARQKHLAARDRDKSGHFFPRTDPDCTR